jgi:hypothetical protein
MDITYVNAYRKAAHHLRSHGLLPAPFREELQALWGGTRADRALVQAICENWEISP